MSQPGFLSQDGQPPDVLALPLGRARQLLAASGWQVERLLLAQSRQGNKGAGEATVAAPQPSECEEWRVIRQRTLAPGQVELLVASEMHPRA